jgi:hypothetical protein
MTVTFDWNLPESGRGRRHFSLSGGGRIEGDGNSEEGGLKEKDMGSARKRKKRETWRSNLA